MQKPKLSNPSKMPGSSWDLQALKTCPGRKYQTGKKRGQVKPVCSKCYAQRGHYTWRNSKNLRQDNREDWRRDDWTPSMVAVLAFETDFRWFSSGDCYRPELGEKIYQVMKATPQVNHWLSTMSHELDSMRGILAKMARLPNVVVRKSSGSIVGETMRGKNTSTVIASDSQAPAGAHICPAKNTGGKCHTCRACWDKSVRVVAYPYH